jgi:hypothetical protein
VWLCATGAKPAKHEVLSTRGVSQPRATEAFWVGPGGAAAVAEELASLLEAPGNVAAVRDGADEPTHRQEDRDRQADREAVDGEEGSALPAGPRSA